MTEIISEEELRTRIDRSKIIEIPDDDGDEAEARKMGFRIRPVPLIMWDPSNSWYSDLRANKPEEFAKMLGERVQAPTAEVMRAVLLRGIQKPQITAEKNGSGVSVDDLLARNILALRLYAAIAAYSCEGLLEVKEEAPNGDSSPSPRC